MSNDLASAAVCYGLYDEQSIIGFIGVLHMPHPKNKKIKRCSRLVILPDYQGIGLGVKFLSFIADIYSKQRFDFCINTTAKNLIHALRRNKKWVFTFCGKPASHSSNSSVRQSWTVRDVKTATFFYCGDKQQ